jgi:hypothetical protein
MIRYNLADSQIAATVNSFRGKQGFVSINSMARLRNHPLDSLDRISKRYPAALAYRACDSKYLMAGFLREQLGTPDWRDQSGRYGLISVLKEA